MKKIIIVLLTLLFVVTGCGKKNIRNVRDEVKNKLEKSSGYLLNGDLEINNNDEVYNYYVTVEYKKDNFFKVVLENKANNFNQIILKNNDGVFLLSPSLNKSFKFQSEWPYNNSQIYLLNALVNDMFDDSEATFEENDGKYVFKTKVNYPNNKKLISQKITFNDKYELEEVVVYDSNNTICMKFVVDKIKFSPSFDEDNFELDSIIDIQSNGDGENKDEEDSSKEVMGTGSIEDVVYPLFLPSGTKLVDEQIISNDSGERVIMTYDGEKSFLLVEETLNVFNEFTVIPSSGEPYQLMDTIGVMTDNSLSWSSGNMEYYLVSDVMSQEELIEVAQSIVGVISIK